MLIVIRNIILFIFKFEIQLVFIKVKLVYLGINLTYTLIGILRFENTFLYMILFIKYFVFQLSLFNSERIKIFLPFFKLCGIEISHALCFFDLLVKLKDPILKVRYIIFNYSNISSEIRVFLFNNMYLFSEIIYFFNLKSAFPGVFKYSVIGIGKLIIKAFILLSQRTELFFILFYLRHIAIKLIIPHRNLKLTLFIVKYTEFFCFFRLCFKRTDP